MRIAIVNHFRRKVGGTETYIGVVAGALAQAGHELAFCHEVDGSTDRAMIPLPPGTATLCVEELGAEATLRQLRAWRPDVIFVQGVHDTRLEARLVDLAPAVLLAHTYYGTCISGTKALMFPTPRPCARRFGPACLAHYFPRRCGGLNPVTMVQMYHTQRRRFRNLARYRTIVTFSEHMRCEFLRHGLPPERVVRIDPCLDAAGPDGDAVALSEKPPAWNLLYSGRMDALKGGLLLIKALGTIAQKLDRPIHVTFAGDGSERAEWQRLASVVCQQVPGIDVEFPGWVAREQMRQLLAEAHLVVVPSVWPEPFGFVGPEAGLHGVPVAGFAVGGIPDWLIDGVNGHLASGDPPTASGLADAAVRCIADPEHYLKLRAGATHQAQRWLEPDRHVLALTALFQKAMAPVATRSVVVRR